MVGEHKGSNQLQRTYVTPGLDQNLSLTSSGSTYYYLADALGSIRQVIDANEPTQTRSGGTPRRGRRPQSYDYEAFGSVYGTPTENLTQPFRFTGRAWDSESEQYYYRTRSYHPSSGRFLSRDPLVLLPAYGYVANAPTAFVDPLGLIRIDEFASGQVGSFKALMAHAESVAAQHVSASGAVNYGGFVLAMADWEDPANTPKYGYFSAAGLIDMPHFYSTMLAALGMKMRGTPPKKANYNAADAAYLWEWGQALAGSYSRWTREDIPSDALGAYFAAFYLTGMETPEEFLQKLRDFLGPLGPIDWSDFCDEDKKRLIDHYGVKRGMSPEEHKKREARRADANAGDPLGVVRGRGPTDFPFETSPVLGHAIVGEKD